MRTKRSINEVFIQRLESLLEGKDLRKTDLAAYLQVERSTVSRYAQGRVPDAETLAKIAGFFGVSTDYLIGVSNQRTQGTTVQTRHPTLPFIRFPEGVKSVLKISQKLLPILGRIKAGVPLLAEEHVIGDIEVPDVIAGQADFALEVAGDSMVDAGLQAGDYVFMRAASRRPPAHGDIVAAMIDQGDMTLKRYIKRADQYWLHAENPHYNDIPVDNRVVIQGVYVGRFSQYIGNVEPPLDDMNEDELITKLALRRGVDPDQVAGMLDVLSRGKKR